MEVWKDIKGFEGKYQISSLGNIKSLSNTKIYKDGRVFHYKEKILKSYPNRVGYHHVNLFFETGKSKSVDLHRIAAETFLDNPLNKTEVNHLNGIKSDNRINNLEWVTSSQNKIHGFRIGLYKRENQGPKKRNGNKLLSKT